MPVVPSLVRDARHGPLPALLLLLTCVTGLVDAISYLKLGHVFVANMTGNIVFFGFAMGGARDFSVLATAAAVMAFVAGAAAGGRIGRSQAIHRGRLLATGSTVQIGLLGAALLAYFGIGGGEAPAGRYTLTALLALAMGLQNAIARRLAVPDLTTTVLTMTLTGVAADSMLAGGQAPNRTRRWLAIAAMFLGAAVGTVLAFYVSVGAVLALALALVLSIGLVSRRLAASSEPWTHAV